MHNDLTEVTVEIAKHLFKDRIDFVAANFLESIGCKDTLKRLKSQDGWHPAAAPTARPQVHSTGMGSSL